MGADHVGGLVANDRRRPLITGTHGTLMARTLDHPWEYVAMSRSPLTPLEQADILAEVTKLLVEAMPEDWQELVLLLDMLGRHNQCSTRLTRADGSRESWKVPTEALKRLASLRSGMYVDGEGTWFSCRYAVVLPGTYTISYERQGEPPFRRPPTTEDFEREQRRFPRADAYMPDWYRAGLQQTGV
ncbi:hypothetical protein GCM10023191_005330 [Actinoallomurus oryzae]|uniref:Uncharacterized protein n=2 Tax=Actinoallomurus oryzae TaxID=502180 RepID=A0ABP8PBK9_9ACTN